LRFFLNSCQGQKIAYESDVIGATLYNDVTVEEAKILIDKSDNIYIVDVRTQNEFNAGHIKGAVQIPVDEFEKAVNEGKIPPGKTVLIYCQSGNRSSRAADMLGKTGYNNVKDQSVNNMIGGFGEWQLKGYPVEYQSNSRVLFGISCASVSPYILLSGDSAMAIFN